MEQFRNASEVIGYVLVVAVVLLVLKIGADRDPDFSQPPPTARRTFTIRVLGSRWALMLWLSVVALGALVVLRFVELA